MFIYAGIDEAGYGPLFGPLVVGRYVLSIDKKLVAASHRQELGFDVWSLLDKAVCKDLKSARGGKIAVNDSKKLTTASKGIKHLERALFAFAKLAQKQDDQQIEHVGDWLDRIGETTHHALTDLPWYQTSDTHPWQSLPATNTPGELAVDSSMLANTAKTAGVGVIDFGGAVVFENKFNQMVQATRSKAATSFTFVAGHLQHIYKTWGQHHPFICVDRQGGRTHYQKLLSFNFPQLHLTIEYENENASLYKLISTSGLLRSMTICFAVQAEQQHMPVALASMLSKYTRQLLMGRFQTWFTQKAPHIKPTQGYASDAKRFWREIEPLLPSLGIQPDQLKRLA